jgi:hypothetical protein
MAKLTSSEQRLNSLKWLSGGLVAISLLLILSAIWLGISFPKSQSPFPLMLLIAASLLLGPVAAIVDTVRRELIDLRRELIDLRHELTSRSEVSSSANTPVAPKD